MQSFKIKNEYYTLLSTKVILIENNIIRYCIFYNTRLLKKAISTIVLTYLIIITREGEKYYYNHLKQVVLFFFLEKYSLNYKTDMYIIKIPISSSMFIINS